MRLFTRLGNRSILLLFLVSSLVGQGQPVELIRQDFDLKVDMFAVELPGGSIAPKPGVVKNIVGSDSTKNSLRIFARAKPLADTLDTLQVEVYIENLQDFPVDHVAIFLDQQTAAKGVLDLTTDAYNQQPLGAPYTIQVGRIAANGIKRVILGIKKSFSPHIRGYIDSKASAGEGQTSTNILVTPANDELWALSSDTDEVVAYSLPGKEVLARIKVGAQPSGLALQQNLDWIVVSSAKGNTVSIIDRASKTVINTLGKNEEFGRELQFVLVSQKNPVVYVSSYVEGILSELTFDANAQLVSSRSLQIGARPTGMSMTFDESQIYAAHFLPRGPISNNEAWISVIKLPSFRLANDAIIEDHFNPSNPRMQCLADFYNGYLPSRLIYRSLTAKDFSLEGVASQLSGVFLDPSGQIAWVPGTRITGALVVLERGPNADKSLKRFGGLLPGQLSAPLIFPLDASKKTELHNIYTRDVEMALPSLKKVVYCMRHPLEIEFIDRALINRDKQQTNPFLAYGVPHAGLTSLGLINTIRFTKGGRFALMLSHISDEIAVYDATTINPATQLHFQLSGSNPKGMTVSADGKKIYVLYENSDFISEIDSSAYSPDNAAELAQPFQVPYHYSVTKNALVQLGGVVGLPLIRDIDKVALRPSLKELSRLKLRSNDPLTAAMRRGKILFASANPDKYPISANRLGACASCHPNGANDGTSWVTMEGPRRTISLRGGVAERGYLHSSATHGNSHEFVETIVPERLGGSLDARDTNAVALYIDHGIPKLQGPRVDKTLAQRGEVLFQTNCAGCHSGPALTSGLKPDKTPRLYEIGICSPDHGVAAGRFSNTLVGLADSKSREIADALVGDRPLGGEDPIQKILDYRPRPKRNACQFKAPSLVNAFDNAVFFHDGSVDKLKDAIRQVGNLLNLNLSETDLDALEAYVKTL